MLQQIKRLTADAVAQRGLPADVALAIKSNLAIIITLNAQIDLLEEASARKGGGADGICLADQRTGNRPHSGDHHSAGDRTYRTLQVPFTDYVHNRFEP
ncbi:MAG: hypothetical protein WB870_13825 [Gallionellaceae bacterium]